jgi:hypothetical protein
MDNDNEIAVGKKEIISHEAEVRLFLREELLPLEKSRQVSTYNLITEYAKTKKNKNPFIWIVLGSCAAIVALVTILVTMRLSGQNKKIEVKTGVFNDLDMRSLLGTKTHTEITWLIAANKTAQLENEYSHELKQAALDRDSDLYVLMSLRPESGIEEQKKDILTRYNKRIAAAHKKYDGLMKSAAAETEEAKQKLDSVDASKAEASDFASQVQQHERSWLVNSYTETVNSLRSALQRSQQNDFEQQRAAVTRLADKYQKEVDSLDPVLTDDNADRIIRNASALPLISYDMSAYVTSLPRDILTDNFLSGMKTAQNLFTDYNYMHKALAAIPQKHSMALYKDAENRLIYQMSSEFGKASASQIDSLNQTRIRLEQENGQLQQQNAELKKQGLELQDKYSRLSEKYSGVADNTAMFESWFEKQAADDKAAGYILEISGSDRMKVFLVSSVRDSMFTSGSDLPVTVIHGKWKKVTAGTVSNRNGVYYFIPGEAADAAKILAGDKLIVQVR